MTRTTLFLSNKTQAVRLPKEVAFGEGVRAVVVLREDQRRVIVPADQAWDDFFDAPGVDLGLRDQPALQTRGWISPFTNPRRQLIAACALGASWP